MVNIKRKVTIRHKVDPSTEGGGRKRSNKLWVVVVALVVVVGTVALIITRPGAGEAEPAPTVADVPPSTTVAEPALPPAPAESESVEPVPQQPDPAPASPSPAPATAPASTGPKSIASSPTTSSDAEVALDVVRGRYGNGQERKDRLGNRYEAVQSRVNEMYRQGLVQ